MRCAWMAHQCEAPCHAPLSRQHIPDHVHSRASFANDAAFQPCMQSYASDTVNRTSLSQATPGDMTIGTHACVYGFQLRRAVVQLFENLCGQLQTGMRKAQVSTCQPLGIRRM